MKLIRILIIGAMAVTGFALATPAQADETVVYHNQNWHHHHHHHDRDTTIVENSRPERIHHDNDVTIAVGGHVHHHSHDRNDNDNR